MKLFTSIVMVLFINSQLIFDFNNNANISDWKIVDDVVMGGRSNGTFKIDSDGNGVFSGEVSLENNGGFSSLRYQFEQKNVEPYTTATIRLKGDGKRYQFRVKSDQNDYQSYIYYFNTKINIP